jgi:uncharacterized membrane protein
MSTLSAPAIGDRASRIVLFVSLALNLFFLGVLGATAVRQFWPQAPAVFQPSASAAERIDRLAATLPAEDAGKLRGEFRAREAALEKAHTAYRLAQDAVRTALRAEPFDAGALRAAMADRRAARQALDLALNDVIAAAAARMSPAGREKLASWTPPFGGAQPK